MPVRPIPGGFDPYRRLPTPKRDQVASGATALRVIPRADAAAPADAAAEPGTDTELSVRFLAHGGSITVKRRTVADGTVEGGRRTIGIDLPGFGLSDMPSEDISISGYGRAVNSLCDELDLGEAVFVGNSMGGFISAEVAIQFPERAARIVLVSAAGVTTSDLASGPILAGARVVAAVATRTAAASATEKIVRRRHLKHAAYHSFIRHPTRLRSELLYEITRGSGKPGFMDALRAIMDYDFRDRLPEIRCPTLIVWGTDDMLVPESDAGEFERLISRSRKVVFEDTGHMAMIERPQTFNDCLVEFLAEEPTPAASEAAVESSSATT